MPALLVANKGDRTHSRLAFRGPERLASIYFKPPGPVRNDLFIDYDSRAYLSEWSFRARKELRLQELASVGAAVGERIAFGPDGRFLALHTTIRYDSLTSHCRVGSQAHGKAHA
jgi:hypothetical protein